MKGSDPENVSVELVGPLLENIKKKKSKMLLIKKMTRYQEKLRLGSNLIC
jgi:hypothetical protein